MNSNSDSSDSEYEQSKGIESASDNEQAEHSSPKGPQTPKSSPRSQSRDSVGPVHSRDHDDSGEIGSPLSDSQGPVSPAPAGRGPRSPSSPPPADDDDGRSDISSGSSLLSNNDNKDEDLLQLEPGDADLGSPAVKPPPTNTFPVSNADDLSDVSDLDDSDGLDDKEEPEPERKPSDRNGDLKKEKETLDKWEKEREKEERKREVKNSLTIDDGEQLDFEADDQPEDKDKEDGEIESSTKKDKEEEDKSGDEGEVKEDDAESLEDGEVTDEGDPKPEKPPVCRFYSRGACTWGVNCRFLHPGVTDKGNYTMFDVGRPMVATPNGAVMYPPEHRPAYGHPMMMPPARVLPGPYGPVVRREDPAMVESAWERGLRQAKEMMRKSTKRKETDMDFEEKKMNLSIGQEEIDKENDYYTRAASPVDEQETWSRLSPKAEAEPRRPAVRVVERYEDIVAEPMSPPFYDKYDYRRGYKRPRDPAEYGRREKYVEEDELAPKKLRREKTVREVIVQRVEKPARHYGEEVPRKKADEWSDPWMRSKSPSRKTEHRARKTSYSSASSSFSSRSGSKSRSLSNSRSPDPTRPHRPKTPPFPSRPGRAKKATSPKDPKFKPLKTTISQSGEKKVAMMMNPPAPTPKRVKERPLSPSQMRKVGLNPPPPTPKGSSRHLPKQPGMSRKAGKVRSRKSRSSSASGSSGSSSESSRSSYSTSSSSSRGGTPPARPMKPTKKIEPNERLAAQTLKGKGVDALKVAGQKPQIKLTLKPAEAKRGDKAGMLSLPSKKRPGEDASIPEPKIVAAPVAKPSPAKKTTSRREELLKQLKAVEDAIARKRSKI